MPAVNKKAKANEARKRAEAQKAVKKQTRATKATPEASPAKGGNKKPASLIKQSKTKK